MAAKNQIAFNVKLQGWKQLSNAAKDGSTEIKRLGDTVEKAGDKAKASDRGWSRFSRSADRADKQSRRSRVGIKSMAGAVAGLAGAFGGLAVAKDALNVTTGLAKTVGALGGAFGFADDQATAFAAVAKTRGIDDAKLIQSFTVLSKSTRAAVTGQDKQKKSVIGLIGQQQLLTKKGAKRAEIEKIGAKISATAAKSAGAQSDAFQRLGVSQKLLRSGDTAKLLEGVAHGLKLIKNPQERMVIGTRLFGKSYGALRPILSGGSKALREQLDLAKKYVPNLGASADAAKDLAAQQREQQLASLGLKVAIGSALLPIQLKATTAVTKFVRQIKDGTGFGGKFKAVLDTIGAAFKKVTNFVEGSKAASFALGGALGALGAAWAVQKVVNFAVALRKLFLVQKLVTAATWLFSKALFANPIGMVVLGLAALAGGFYLAYKRIGWFRRAVDATFGFVKKNWPTILAVLTGPIGLAALFIIRKWKSITGAFRRAKEAIASGAVGMFDGIKNAFRDAINFVISGWNSLRFKIPGFDPPGPGPKFGGIELGVPRIPELAKGGILRAGGSMIVGDGGGPELYTAPRGARVDPLPRNGGLGALLRDAMASIAAPAAMAGGDATVHVHVHLDGRQIAESTFKQTNVARARR